jgi:hypothetical protein
VNYALLEIVSSQKELKPVMKKIEERHDSMCFVCTVVVIKYSCEECAVGLCEECWQRIHCVGTLVLHKKIDGAISFKPRCEKHPASPLDFMCLNKACNNSPMCQLCIGYAPHVDHKYVLFDEIYFTKFQLLAKQVDTIHEITQGVIMEINRIKAITERNEELIQDSISDSEEQFKKLFEYIEARKSCILMRIRETSAQRAFFYAEQLRVLTEFLEKIEFEAREPQRLILHGSPHEFLSSFDIHSQALRELPKCRPTPVTTPAIPSVRYEFSDILDKISNFGVPTHPLLSEKASFIWRTPVFKEFVAGSSIDAIHRSPIWQTADEHNLGWSLMVSICQVNGGQQRYISVMLLAEHIMPDVATPDWYRTVEFVIQARSWNSKIKNAATTSNGSVTFSSLSPAHASTRFACYTPSSPYINKEREMEFNVYINVIKTHLSSITQTP